MTGRTVPEGSGLVLLFADLDDSCFQTERKCPPGVARQAAAWDRTGEAVSFQLPAQVALLELLTRGALLIPVTGRNRSALDRTVYRDAPFAITSFGGSIHTPAGLDRSWSSRRPPVVADQLDAVCHAAAAVIRSQALPLRCRVVEESDGPHYVSVKAESPASPPFAALVGQLRTTHALPRDWQLFSTDRSLALAPPHLGKAAAVRDFLSRHAPPHTCTVGLGDGPADAEFLALCDFAMTPRDSTLQRTFPRLGQT